MNGNNHLFTMIDTNKFPIPFEYMVFLSERSNNVISIPDEIIRYIGDTLRWVNTTNPANNNSSFSGLNPFGPTIIDPIEAHKLRLICEGWIDLFKVAPETVHLTGNWSNDIDDAGNESQGYYEDIAITKIHLLQYLQSVLNLSQIASEKNLFILHYGL